MITGRKTLNTGRPTLDPKPQTVKLRLNDAMRDWVEQCSDREGISMSEYIRELIRRDMRSHNALTG